MNIRVLMVCLGNICRSPTAEVALRAALKKHQLDRYVYVDSAGTAAWHVGKAPDQRSQSHAAVRGYDLSELRARQVRVADFQDFDYVLAMDKQNLAELAAIKPSHSKAELALFLSYSANSECLEVPDPYYGGDQGFEQVLDLVDAAAEGFVAHILQHDIRPHIL